MTVQLDMQLKNHAMYVARVRGDDVAACDAMITYLADSSGANAYEVVTLSPLCGPAETKAVQRRTRSQRARRIRRELKPELQAVGLLPLGPIIWLILTSPTVWLFLFKWIRSVLADVEE